MKSVALCLLLTIVLTSVTTAGPIEFVVVGNPGNPDDTRYGSPEYGRVDATFAVGRYEVTAGQYAEFLNAVAVDRDRHWLYNPDMFDSEQGCKIQRSGTEGDYSYRVEPAMENRPVNFVSFWDASRFVNWLHNGKPDAPQDLYTTTEDGAYMLGRNTEAGVWVWDDQGIGHYVVPPRNRDAQFYIPNVDEWYKAAYHKNDGTDEYWTYPTQSDSPPGRNIFELTDPGNNANYGGAPHPIDGGRFTTLVGEFELSEGPYGTFDQAGNVWEWTEHSLGESRRIRGGSFHYGKATLAASMNAAERGIAEQANLGFRVVQHVPEPSNGMMATLIILVIFVVMVIGPTINMIAAFRRK